MVSCYLDFSGLNVVLVCVGTCSETMSQVYAIELYFDQGLENHVLKAWNVLSRRQLSTKLMESGSRPHLTLFSSHFVDIAKLEDILRNFASKQGLLPLSLSSVGILPNENNVLFLGPTPSVALLQFHSQLCDAMKKEGIEIGEDYRPDNWIPYCPVSWVEEVPKNRVAEGVTVLRDLKLPFNGFAIHIAVVEYLPARELFSFSLGTDHVSDF